MGISAKEFAEKYGMSVKAAESTLAAYAADPGDEQWSTISQEDLDSGAMADLASGAASIIYTPGIKQVEKELEKANPIVDPGTGRTGGIDPPPGTPEPYIGSLSTLSDEQYISLGAAVGTYDTLGYPGESQALVAAQGGDTVIIDNPSMPWVAMFGVLWSLVTGSSTVMAALLAIGVLLVGYLLGKVTVSGDQAIYIGNRLAGMIRGTVTENTARGFGMRRITSKRAGGEGHQVQIVR